MIDRYLIEVRDSARGDWITHSDGGDTPTSAYSATQAYCEAQSFHGPDWEYRVTLLDHDTNSFSDVTISIEMAIEEHISECEIWARENAEHERSESLRGVFV